MDKVILKNMPFDLAVGLDQWRRVHKPQPVLITLEAQPTSTLEPAAAKDDVSLSMDYGKLYKRISESFRRTTVETFPSIQALIAQVEDQIYDCGVLSIDILLPKALPQSNGGVLYKFQVDKSEGELNTTSLSVTIKQIACNCIIGVNPHERIYKQTIYVNISVPMINPATGGAALEDNYPAGLHDMTQTVWERVEGSSYYTLEALATAVAQIVTVSYGHTFVIVRIEKPSAIATIEAPAIEITRSKTFFENKDFWKVKRP